nr:uncharacterized protein DDB_G0290685 [Nothobranchius furzeri]
MKVLVLFVAGVLGCSLTGALTISRCELVKQLKAVDKSLKTEDLAKIVCDVMQGSNFSTSVVTKQTIKEGDKDSKRRSIGSHFGSSGNDDHKNITHPVENDRGNSSVGHRDGGHTRHRRDAAKVQDGTKNVTHPVENDHGNSSVGHRDGGHTRHRRDAAKVQDGTKNVTHPVENDHGNSSVGHRDGGHTRNRRDAAKVQNGKDGTKNVTHPVENDRGNSSVGHRDGGHTRNRRDAAKVQDGTKNVTHPVENDHGNSSVGHRHGGHTHHRRDAAMVQDGKEGTKNVTLYGIFQLPDCVCSSSVNASKGICGVSCSSLVDDSIEDDIKCLLLLTGKFGGKSRDKYENNEDKNKSVCRFIQQEVCKNVTILDYLGKCS